MQGLCVFVAALLVVQAGAVPASSFFSYGTPAGDSTITVSPEEIKSLQLQLNSTFVSNGHEHNIVYVTSNGIISLGQDLNLTLGTLPDNQALIAPFWTSYHGGQVHYRQSVDTQELSKANQAIETTFGDVSLTISSIVIITWENMQGMSDTVETNTFQCVLVSGTRSYVLMYYLTGGMQWRGSPLAQVGVSGGGLSAVTLPTSGTEKVLDIADSGNAEDGLWVWRVDSLPDPGLIIGWEQTSYTVSEARGSFNVCITAFRGTPSLTTVRARVTGGTTADSRDYTARDLLLSFTDQRCTTVTLYNDQVLEEVEFISLELQPSSGTAALLPRNTIISIEDDDSAIVRPVMDTVPVSEAAGQVRVCGQLVNNAGNFISSKRNIKVAYSTSPGTAQENVDYSPVIRGELMFAADQLIACTMITIEDDEIFENDEIFYFTFTEAISNRISVEPNTRLRVMIQDDDAHRVSLEFDQSAYSVREGDAVVACVRMTAGLLEGSFNITMRSRQAFELSGSLRLATLDIDYTRDSIDFEFNTSNLGDRRCITTITHQDSVYEGEEIFGFEIYQEESLGLNIGRHRLPVRIIDDDEIQIAWLQSHYDFFEGQTETQIEVCVNRTGEIESLVQLQTTIQLGTASFYNIRTDTGDVNPLDQEEDQIQLLPNSAISCINIIIQDDVVFETEVETLSINMAYHDSLVELPPPANISIHDNDMVTVEFLFLPSIEIREEDNADNTQLYIVRRGSIDIPLFVSLVPVNGTATEHEDYEARGDMVTFVPTSSDRATEPSTISVTLLDDPVVEGEESLELRIMAGEPRIQIAPQIVTITIREEDEVIVGFTEQSLTVNEGDGYIEVCLTLRGYTAQPFVVQVSTTGVTAQEGIDFVSEPLNIELPPTSDEVLFALYQLSPPERLNAMRPESSPQCARIQIINDAISEQDSNKQLDLSLQTNNPNIVVDRSKSSATISIQDDDFVSVELEMSTLTVSENAGTAHVCARLLGEADFEINAQLRTFSTSALADLDYVAETTAIQFPAHSTESQCADFMIIDDDILENQEQFLVELRVITTVSQVSTGSNRTVIIYIMDNDFVEVVFEAVEYSEEEGNEVEVCALLRGVAVRPVSTILSTRASVGGTPATANVDYRAIANMTLFNEGISLEPLRQQCVSITLDDDDILENTESFQVFLSSEDSGVRTTADSVTNVYILDNDGVRVGIQEREYVVLEGQGSQSICVDLIGRIQRSINLELSTGPSSATGDADYTSIQSIELVFQASDSSTQTLCSDFPILDDTIYEFNETFFVMLSVDAETTGVSVHIPRATLIIVDDDEVTLGFQEPTYEVSEGAERVQVCVEMTGRTETGVECLVFTQPGTAQQDDYTSTGPVSLVFPESPGTTSVQCTFISIVDDQILEIIESFTVGVTSEAPRVTISRNSSTVDIIDDDSVRVGFTQLLVNVSEDIESERSVMLCVQLSGVIEKNVTVRVATESSNNLLRAATANIDYLPLEEELEFSPNEENSTKCVLVTVFDDLDVEGLEQFNVVVSSQTDGVTTLEGEQRATVSIRDEDVVCEASSTDTTRGFFEWDETYPGHTVVLPCTNGTVTRHCSIEGVWGPPEVESCYASVDAILIHVIRNLPTDDGGLSLEYLEELIRALHRLRRENPNGLERFIGDIYTIFHDYSRNVTRDIVDVDPEVYRLILVVVDILHFPEWPLEIVQTEPVKLVSAVEAITEGLIKTDGFKRVLNLENNFISFSLEKGSSDELFPQNEIKKKTIAFVRRPDQEIITRLSSSITEEEGTVVSSISLPNSIATHLTDSSVGLYFGFYEKSVLFPLIVNNGTEILRPPASVEVSPVIMATVSQTIIRDIKDPINYSMIIGHRNYSDPVCVSWDFEAVGGRGNWTTEGCKLISDAEHTITCSCSHLTNFAILLNDVRPSEGELVPRTILSPIMIVGVGISLLGLVMTIITLLLFSKLRRRDTTVLRIQFCLSVALMLIAFVSGIARVEIFELCVSISAFIHYFTLVSLMWMAAEAVLMVQKLIASTKTSVAYFIIASIICWFLPIPAVVVPIGIDRNFGIHEQYCFISHNIVFYASFLGPVAGILIFNLIMFFLAFIIILRYCGKRSNDNKLKKRRAAVRTIFTILMVMLTFGLTWTFGALTILMAMNYFEYLFVIFNSLQGLFIFLIFVVFAKETRDLWLQTCGCKEKKTDAIEETDNLSRRVSRNPSLRKSGDELDDVSFDFEGADHLEALKALDKETRLNMNSWDVMYIMPQNTFDIFLNSDQFQQPSFPMAASITQPTSVASPEAPTLTSPIYTPTSDINIREDQSMADSGILADQIKTGRSPRRLAGEPITTIEESERRNSYHVHSVSGIGYVSADSDDEFLDRTSPPVLATPPSRRRSKAYGDRFKRELHNLLNPHESEAEIEVITSDFKIDITP